MSEQEILIRTADLEDAGIIAGFNAAMAQETENKTLDRETALAGVKNLLKNPQHGFYLVAQRLGETAGSLMVTSEWSDWRNGLFWWIQSVYVRPEFRRQGIYSRLYAHVKKMALERPDIRGLRLYVERENAAAHKTYQALGMREAHYRIFEESLEK